MTILRRRSFHGAELLGSLDGVGNVFITDVELTDGWGLLVTLRLLDLQGEVPAPPAAGPGLLPPLSRVNITAALNGAPLTAERWGVLGSVAEWVSIYRFPASESTTPSPAMVRIESELGNPVEVPLQ
jgi:hypothetical protein